MKGLKLVVWESEDPIKGYMLILTSAILAFIMKMSLIRMTFFMLMSAPRQMLNYPLFTMFSYNAYVVIILGASFLIALTLRGERDEGSAYFIYSLPISMRGIILAKIMSVYLSSLLVISVTHVLIFLLHFSSSYSIKVVLKFLPIILSFYASLLLYIVSISTLSSLLIPNAPTVGILSFFLIFLLSNLKFLNPTITVQEVLVGNYVKALLPYLMISIVVLPTSIWLFVRRDVR